MSERPTPETDCESGFFDMETAVGAAFARRLERERDEAREERDKLQAMRKEVVAANKGAKVNAQVSNSLAGKLNRAERERDEAREAIQNLKLQLGLWEDGNLISQETVGEIRLLKEQINGALRERNEAHKIAERAIDDLAWFNYSNAQRLRSELDQLKEGAK